VAIESVSSRKRRAKIRLQPLLRHLSRLQICFQQRPHFFLSILPSSSHCYIKQTNYTPYSSHLLHLRQQIISPLQQIRQQLRYQPFPVKLCCYCCFWFYFLLKNGINNRLQFVKERYQQPSPVC
jgi:hypothetical protein